MKRSEPPLASQRVLGLRCVVASVRCVIMDDAVADSEQDAATPSTGVVTRVLRIVGWTAIVSGLLILGFVAQQLFVTTWFAQQNQDALAEEAQEHFAATEVAEVEYAPPATQDTTPEGSDDVTPPGVDDPQSDAAPDRSEPRSLLVETKPASGDAFAVIRIPSIERLRDGWTVVEGVGVRDLKNGAGHMPTTPLPGLPGNSVISGHRTTYGAPFHELDTLEAGDIIEVETAIGTHTYEVREVQIVRPTDVWVTDTREGSWLTLTTCHPKFSSRRRLVVFAELVDGPNYEAIYA
jgi:sortase A